MPAASRLLSCFLLLAALAAGACDDEPITPGEDIPGAPRTAPVLLDTTDYLVASPYPGDVDSFTVVVPDGRTVGVIIDASGPLGVKHGPTEADVVYSFEGAMVTGISSHTTSGELPITVQHIVPYFDHASYHLRIVAVDSMPEHAIASLSTDATFRHEWIDPPLDLDVYTIDFTNVDRYFVELQSEDEDVSVSARVVTPSGLAHFVILEAGVGVTRGAVYVVDEPGEHQLLIHAAGLKPDVEARYRFRIVDADAPETASADH